VLCILTEVLVNEYRIISCSSSSSSFDKTTVTIVLSEVSSQRNERKERKNRKLQPIGTELSSFLLNSSFKV